MRSEQVRAFFDQTDRYLHQSFGIRVRAEIVSDLLGELRNSRILDIGCGNGGVSRQFLTNGNELVLMDLSANMLERAAKFLPETCDAQVKFIQGDFMNHEALGSFEVILCIGVLAHVSDASAALNRVSELLGSGGRCVMQFTDSGTFIAKINERIARLRSSSYPYEVARLEANQFESLVMQSRLKIRTRKAYSLLLPGMGHLPEGFLYRFQQWSYRNPFASALGMDKIYLLEKQVE